LAPFIITVAFAQAAAVNAEVAGIVLDPSGAAVQNATVQVENLNTGYGRTATTTFAGFYRVPLLPLGEYSLTVEADGFAPSYLKWDSAERRRHGHH
jgi:hypothetical protein